MESPKYGDVVRFKITRQFKDSARLLDKARRSSIIQKAKRYFLVDGVTLTLAFRDNNTELVRCLLLEEVVLILTEYHKHHRHFSGQLVLRKLTREFYWPTRVKDTLEFYKTCFPCQMVGPLRPSRNLLPVL